MSAEDTEELMDTSDVNAGTMKRPPAADVDMMAEVQSQDVQQVQQVISIKWEDTFPTTRKREAELTKALQSWATRNDIEGDFIVVHSSDNKALINISRASALTKLLEAKGQTLDVRGKEVATLLSIGPPGPQVPQDVPMALPSPSAPHLPRETEKQQKQTERSSSVADSAAEEVCHVPIGHYWYVNHIYKEKIDRIQKENGVQISAQIEVKLAPCQKNGDTQKALDEFQTLMRTTSTESEGFNFPLEKVSPEAWANMLKVLQKKGDKVLLTLLSKEIMVCGPGQGQDAISQSLNTTMQKPSGGAAAWSSDGTPKTIGLNINDPLVYAGVVMDESIWRMMMTASYEIAKLTTKFDVDFKESGFGPGQVNIKVSSRRSKPNKSMESHAIRALLRLYQRNGTSTHGLVKHLGVSGLKDPPKASDYQPEGASGGAASNGPPGHGKGDTEEPRGGAAAAGDDEDNICAICLDKLNDKVQLKCKHEFCKVCLEQSKKSQGPICPMCKDVFGVVEGDQPDGRMTWKTTTYHLSGFPQYGTIVISYDIPSGKQTKRHPNPGKYYPKIYREAYLPDSKEGREVLHLLKRAFDQKLIFTIGTSRTSGLENQVTWNDIHHKTSPSGGPLSFGYPDPDYLSRVREELKAKGIK